MYYNIDYLYKYLMNNIFTQQIGLIILNFLLFVAAIYDLIFSRRLGGDPTISHRDPSGVEATTFNNPAFKEKRSMNPSELITITLYKNIIRHVLINHNFISKYFKHTYLNAVITVKLRNYRYSLIPMFLFSQSEYKTKILPFFCFFLFLFVSATVEIYSIKRVYYY